MSVEDEEVMKGFLGYWCDDKVGYFQVDIWARLL